MPQDNARQDVLDGVATIVAPRPGVSLAQYVEYLRSRGKTTAVAEGGKHAWVPGSVPGSMQRYPMECNDPVDPGTASRLLRLPGVRVLFCLVPPVQGLPANCFDYVCRDPDYDVERLPTNARRDIRRGLRCFQVRLCSWEEIAQKGLQACIDTDARHGLMPPTQKDVDDFVQHTSQTSFIDVWGAWEGEELAAWMVLLKVDDWAMIMVARSRNDKLKNCPNNALLYVATKHLLCREKRAFVSYGSSSVVVDSGELSLHKYKIRMGYEAIPVHRMFVTGAIYSLFLKSSLMAWTWEKLLRVFPASRNLRKLASVSRILSGREDDPLAWTTSSPGGEQQGS